ncbi:hypothetical protein PGH07_02135 [Sulfurovum sp. zt1-1]|uniref:Uncharacterized protein n=1 Tax=Sulfurovum zhangzhouensis TaxID=3019067 RepID=A0ABT7QVV6_9BACT|nr:hypothetical protein [Sulfurovum zhangzhouensis]MDM5270974.1 hypothetical protein [Sulfurovum zhangzhouensis]
MWKRCSLIFLLTLSLHAYENEFRVENSNFTLSQASLPAIFSDSEDRYLYNYDRLRVYDTFTYGSFYTTAIVDLVNYAGESYINSFEFDYIRQLKPDMPFDTRSTFQYYGSDHGVMYGKIHRLYGGYADEKHQVTVGIQKISMGVGHIWTPTDLYNPKNSFALEPDEVFGVLALSYSYAPSALSTVQSIVSCREDKSLKYGFRYKAFLDFADVGVSFIYSDEIRMYGYEIEGDFFDTGAQWRSEGGYYQSKILDKAFYQAILGFDYAFKNGINLTVEGYYSSDTFTYAQQLLYFNNELAANLVQSNVYLGTSLSYDFDIAWSGSLMMIASLEDQLGSFVAPTVTYTMNDHHKVSVGSMLYYGERGSEFGAFGHTYYLNWKWSF